MKKILNVFLSVIFLICISGCKGPNYLQKKYGVFKYDYYNYLDTISNIVIEYKKDQTTENDVNKKLENVCNMLFDLEKEFSIEQTLYMQHNNIEKSTLMKVNENSGKSQVGVSDKFIEVLEKAIKISKNTKNKFNPAIGALSTLWNISKQAEYCNSSNPCVIPTPNEIENAKSLINVDHIKIDKTNNTIYLEDENMKLDLGGIVKGYAADIIMDYLMDENYTYISINLGGNIKTYGKSYLSNIYSNDSSIVPISIENPNFNVYDKSTIMEVISQNISVVTSGINKRYIEIWDEQTLSFKKYHHLLDPNTGYPVENEIMSVSIIGESSMICDGFSTGVFILGIEEAIKVLKNQNYKGIIVTNDLKIYIVGNIEYRLNNKLEKVYNIIQL